MTNWILHLLASSAGIGFILLIVAKLLPEKAYRTLCRNAGKTVSKGGRGKLGFAWEKVETFIEGLIGIGWEEFKGGLDEDDANENTKEDKPVSPEGDKQGS